MKVFLALFSLIAAIVAAINVGGRIPPDVVAMTIGVVLGAMTTIPVSLFLGVVIARRHGEVAEPPVDMPPPVAAQPPYPRLDGYTSLRNYPPVVIINPAALQTASQPVYPAALTQQGSLVGLPRQFHVVGEEGA